MLSSTGCTIIENKTFHDTRGSFTELYKQTTHDSDFQKSNIAQINLSFSKAKVVRGMHFQRPPYAQQKFIRVISGKIVDTVIDLNPESKTFGQMEEFELDAESNTIIVPGTHAHGFYTLEPTVFIYLCSNVYDKASEGGVNPINPLFRWYGDNVEISDKDKELPSLEQVLAGLK